MSADGQDFSNFNLADSNVYELSNRLIPRIAEGLQTAGLDITITDEPNADDIQSIINFAGTNKVLRDNAEMPVFTRTEIADFVDQSGIQNAQNRSLWTPEFSIEGAHVEDAIVLGAVANWQDRGLKIAHQMPDGMRFHVLNGQRVMDTATETPNPNVTRVKDAFGYYPTEAQYADRFVVSNLAASKRDVISKSYPTKNGDEILENYLREHEDLLDRPLVVLRVANAGALMALQLRAAARKIRPDFDNDPSNPQTFFATDALNVARTEQEEKMPAQYQKGQMALRQALLTGKKIVEAQTEL